MTPAQLLILVNEFLDFLADAPSPAELAQVLTLRTFSSFDARSVAILSLNKQGQIELTGHFNLSELTQQGISNKSIWDEHPISNCIRKRELTSFVTNDLEGMHLVKNQRHHLIPIGIGQASLGALMVSCCTNSTVSIEQFAKTISATLTHYLRACQLENVVNQSNALNVSGSTSAQIVNLKPRQVEILKFMHDGMTTQQIAIKLGYSRSTIHQETILIYRLLGVHNKHEALKMAFSAGYLEDKTAIPS